MKNEHKYEYIHATIHVCMKIDWRYVQKRGSSLTTYRLSNDWLSNFRCYRKIYSKIGSISAWFISNNLVEWEINIHIIF